MHLCVRVSVQSRGAMDIWQCILLQYRWLCMQLTHSFNLCHSLILFQPCISNPTVKLECKFCPNFLEHSEWIFSLPDSQSLWTRRHVSWHYEPVVMGTSCSVRLMELMAGALFQIPPAWPCEQMMHLVYE